MWRRVQVAGFVLVAILMSGVWWNASSQTNEETRISNLETRVTLLEATVTALSGEVVEPSPTSASVTLTMGGSIELTGQEGPDFRITSSGCYGVFGNEDYGVFADVYVRDSAGHVVGQGKLADGRAGPVSKSCKWEFRVDFEAATLAQTYTLAVGRPDGDPIYSFDPSTWPGIGISPGEFLQIKVKAK